MLLEELAPLHGERSEILGIEVLERRLGELGLPGAVVALAAGDDEVGQGKIRRQPAEGGVEGCARHALRFRFRPQAFEEVAEGIGGDDRCHDGHKQGDCDAGQSCGARADTTAALCHAANPHSDLLTMLSGGARVIAQRPRHRNFPANLRPVRESGPNSRA